MFASKMGFPFEHFCYLLTVCKFFIQIQKIQINLQSIQLLLNPSFFSLWDNAMVCRALGSLLACWCVFDWWIRPWMSSGASGMTLYQCLSFTDFLQTLTCCPISYSLSKWKISQSHFYSFVVLLIRLAVLV